MEPLEIVVTGDASEAKSALQAIQGELGRTVVSSKNAGEAFDKMNAQMQRFQRAANSSLNPELVSIYKAKVLELQASMKQLANAADAEAASTFKAEEATKAMSVAVNNTSIGAKRLQAAISRSTDPLQIAAREVNNFSRRLIYMAGAGVMQMAIEGFQLILPYIEEFINGMDKSSSASRLAAANLSNLNEVMADANKKAGEQIADLKILYQTATNVNLSMTDRLAAVRGLQKEFPDYFGNVNKEAILNGDAKKSYDDLTNSIIANARATAAKSKIDEIEAKILDANYQKQKIINATGHEAARAKDRTLESQTSGSSLTGGGAGGQTVTITRAEQLKVIQARKDAALKIQEQNISDLQAQEDFLKKFASLPKLAAIIEKAHKPKKSPKGKDPYTLDLAALEDYYKKVQAKRVKDFDANLTDSKKNTAAINAILLHDEVDFLEKKLELIKKYGKKSGDTELQMAKTNEKARANLEAFNQEQLNAHVKIQNAPALNLKLATEKIDPKIYYTLSDAIKKNIKLQQEHLELMNETANVLNKTVGPAFDTLFTDILSGSKNAFKAFGDALKQMIIQLGAAILKAALFAAILSVINPYATGIPGASGFGAIFKSMLHFSQGGQVKSFAGGGSIDGPGTTTSDSILARVSRGEYIMNAAAVSKFGSSFFDSLNRGSIPHFKSGGAVGSSLVVSSSNNVFIPDVTIKGQDLLITFNRASARASRNG